MSSLQQNSGDLIEFNSADNADVLDKPNGGIVQKIVMGETESATLIATAVAKLTSSSVTVKPIATIPAKSESDPIVSDAAAAATTPATPAPTTTAAAPCNLNEQTVTVVIVPATTTVTQIDTSSSSSNVPSTDSSQSSQVTIIAMIFVLTISVIQYNDKHVVWLTYFHIYTSALMSAISFHFQSESHQWLCH